MEVHELDIDVVGTGVMQKVPTGSDIIGPGAVREEEIRMHTVKCSCGWSMETQTGDSLTKKILVHKTDVLGEKVGVKFQLKEEN